MKKIVYVLSALILTGCVSRPNAFDVSNMAYVIMPIHYEEIAPHRSIFKSSNGLQDTTYFTSAVFKNSVTGAEYTAGVQRGTRYMTRYDSTPFEPGHYDLKSFSIGGLQTEYDEAKCGKIGFDIRKSEVIALKGIRPVAIKEIQGLFGKARRVAYIEFTAEPGDYKSFLKNAYSQSTSVRMLSPSSDRPAAFKACVDAIKPNYKTLSDEKGAFVMPAH